MKDVEEDMWQFHPREIIEDGVFLPDSEMTDEKVGKRGTLETAQIMVIAS